jgi:tetratricopeptide (TPR) repeat protein
MGFASFMGCGGAAQSPAAGAAGPSGSSTPPPVASASATPAPEPPVPEPPVTAEMQAGTKAFDAGNYADARKSFEAAVKKNPKDYTSYGKLGLTCERLADKSCAEVAYKSALSLKPDLDSAAAALSGVYVNEGRVDEALATARTGLANHPGSGVLHESMGSALAARGDQDNASKEFAQAVQLAPSDPVVHLTFAQWLNVWKVRGAAPHLDAASTLVKDDLTMLASIGHEYRMAGEFDSCVKTFDRAIKIKDGGEVRTERALCKLGLKDDKGTLDDLKAAVAKDPNYAPGHYYLGGRLAKNGLFKEAASEYAKVVDLEPKGSLAKAATEKMKLAQDEMTKSKGATKK